MRYTWEDNIKARLTDRGQLLLAVLKLIERGVPEELIPVRLARAFYVDMDELNAVLQLVNGSQVVSHRHADTRFPFVA